MPLPEPYRTGTYLSYDNQPNQANNYREGTAIGLRASGSRQLELLDLQNILKTLAGKVPQGGHVYLVDLRQESHAFFNSRAVSWYADKDWANVGQPSEWITLDEENQIERVTARPRVKVFCLEKVLLLDPNGLSEEYILPTGYSEVTVTSPILEADVVKQMPPTLAVEYHRIPVTDHCKPDDDAKRTFSALCLSGNPHNDWFHFHCHGGDGRTTTFLAMYDMFCWVKSHPPPYPSVEDFVKRQIQMSKYNLNAPCDVGTDWKCSLAHARLDFLKEWLTWVIQHK